MTTGQIVVLVILFSITFACYVGAMFSTKESYKDGFINILFLITFLTLVIVGTSFPILNNYKKALETKCPKYEKVENIYKIKDEKF